MEIVDQLMAETNCSMLTKLAEASTDDEHIHQSAQNAGKAWDGNYADKKKVASRPTAADFKPVGPSWFDWDTAR